VCPTLGQPNESTKEFGPATGHTWIGELGSGVCPSSWSSLRAASSARYCAVSRSTRASAREDARAGQAQRLGLAGLPLGEREQVLALAAQLLGGHVALDDQVGVGLREAVQELEAVREIGEGGGGEQQVDRRGGAGLEGQDRPALQALLGPVDLVLEAADPLPRQGDLVAGELEVALGRLPGPGGLGELGLDPGELALGGLELRLRVGRDRRAEHGEDGEEPGQHGRAEPSPSGPPGSGRAPSLVLRGVPRRRVAGPAEATRAPRTSANALRRPSWPR